MPPKSAMKSAKTIKKPKRVCFTTNTKNPKRVCFITNTKSDMKSDMIFAKLAMILDNLNKRNNNRNNNGKKKH